jgi:rhodanese-related sulfurtransferase
MREAKTVLVEAALVAAVGLVFALAANALSPRGLRLTRDYFPGGGKLATPVATGTNSVSTPGGGSTDPLAATLQRLVEHGLQPIGSNAVMELFQDPRYEQGVLVLVDARDDAHYQKGHIPGAWQFDHYHPDQYLPTVLPVCMGAQKVVVYCNGGACEDSEFATIMLRDAGVPRENLFVYAAGITEWMNSGQSVETGARKSGQMVKAKP